MARPVFSFHIAAKTAFAVLILGASLVGAAPASAQGFGFGFGLSIGGGGGAQLHINSGDNECMDEGDVRRFFARHAYKGISVEDDGGDTFRVQGTKKGHIYDLVFDACRGKVMSKEIVR